MPLEIKIQDGDIVGFSAPAKTRLHRAVEDYASSLIAEANRIEAGRNIGKGPPEITQGMVNDAVMVLRQGLGSFQSKLSSKVLRVVAAILSLVVGFMYDAQLLQQRWYLALFVITIAAAILTLTISILRE